MRTTRRAISQPKQSTYFYDKNSKKFETNMRATDIAAHEKVNKSAYNYEKYRMDSVDQAKSQNASSKIKSSRLFPKFNFCLYNNMNYFPPET